MGSTYIKRGRDRRRTQRPRPMERRVRERRTGIDVQEISGGPACRGLSRALADTGLSPLDQAIFAMVYVESAAGWRPGRCSSGDVEPAPDSRPIGPPGRRRS